ncbi:protein hold'em [Aedes aegypti]|uniref:MEIOB-like N-terminal domain-containing protein n=1 Tax=Aedes aegypti TaxID=7159 RepID=A0A1S4FPI7_AEDAE|nr:protein hold'em [Aedes aegypti]
MSSEVVVTKRISQLNQESRNFLITGVIIAKSEPKFFESTPGKRSGSEYSTGRGVLTVTIRDSDRDTINCTVWGSQVMIESYDGLFHIGDVVNVTNPKVLPSSQDKSEQFNPRSSSPFSLSIGEGGDSGIRLYEGTALDQFRKLVTVAPVLSSDTYPLADIASGGHSISGQNVNVLVVVRAIRPSKQIVIAKTGKLKNLREVIVMDASHGGMSMKFWNSEYVQRIDKWIPMTTVLLIMDVRIEYNQYHKSVCLGMSGKTIITEDPAVEEADQLLLHVMKAPLSESDFAQSLSAAGTVDPMNITTVMTVQQILDRAEGDLKGEEDQFTALCYAVVSRFDLDGCSKIISRKCLTCKSLLRMTDPKCPREECSPNPYNIHKYFDIPVDITDHTGTLNNCRLVSQAAENTLDCNIESFLKMGDVQKGKLKWRFLLERCALKLVIKRKSPIRFQSVYSIVECTIAKPQEVEFKIKVY